LEELADASDGAPRSTTATQKTARKTKTEMEMEMEKAEA